VNCASASMCRSRANRVIPVGVHNAPPASSLSALSPAWQPIHHRGLAQMNPVDPNSSRTFAGTASRENTIPITTGSGWKRYGGSWQLRARLQPRFGSSSITPCSDTLSGTQWRRQTRTKAPGSPTRSSNSRLRVHKRDLAQLPRRAIVRKRYVSGRFIATLVPHPETYEIRRAPVSPTRSSSDPVRSGQHRNHSRSGRQPNRLCGRAFAPSGPIVVSSGARQTYPSVNRQAPLVVALWRCEINCGSEV
jgi:hypothetical protein